MATHDAPLAKGIVSLRDGILIIQGRAADDDAGARQALADCMELLAAGGLASAPLLIVAHATRIPTAEARRVYASAARLDAFGRIAIVADSLSARTVGRFVLLASGRDGSVRFFASERPALAWLRSGVGAADDD